MEMGKGSVWDTLGSYIKAANPVAFECPGMEEDFCLQVIVQRVVRGLSARVEFPVYTWDFARGLKKLQVDELTGCQFIDNDLSIPAPQGDPVLRMMTIIQDLAALKGRSGLFIFLDGAQFLNGDTSAAHLLYRQIKILSSRFKMSGSASQDDLADDGHVRRFIFMGQGIKIHESLSQLMPVVSLPDLTEKEIWEEIQLQGFVYSGHPDYPGYQVPEGDDVRLKLVRNAQGLTRGQIELCMARAAMDYETLDERTAGLFYQSKLQNLERLGLRICPALATEVGGLEIMKHWIQQRIRLFNNPQVKDPLRGFLSVGVPGCGKSLTAMTVGQMLNVPVVLLQADGIFGSLVGQSEQKLREIFRAVESVSPAVLFIDEAEKLFATSETDSVGQRTLGMFLSWMSDRTKPVIVVATANDLSRIPAELLRKGRFDEIFFVDLPNKTERVEIARIHLAKRASALKKAEVSALAESIADITPDYSGAEIAEIIKSASLEAWLRDMPNVVTLELIIEAMALIQPLAKQQPDKVKWMRDQAKLFMPASKQVEVAPERNGRAVPSKI